MNSSLHSKKRVELTVGIFLRQRRFGHRILRVTCVKIFRTYRRLVVVVAVAVIVVAPACS